MQLQLMKREYELVSCTMFLVCYILSRKLCLFILLVIVEQRAAINLKTLLMIMADF